MTGDGDAQGTKSGNLVLDKMNRVLRELMDDPRCGPFLYPISMDDAPGYAGVVQRPMDLTTVRQQLEAGALGSPELFFADMCLIFDNCMAYNRDDSEVFAWARDLKVL